MISNFTRALVHWRREFQHIWALHMENWGSAAVGQVYICFLALPSFSNLTSRPFQSAMMPVSTKTVLTIDPKKLMTMATTPKNTVMDCSFSPCLAAMKRKTMMPM